MLGFLVGEPAIGIDDRTAEPFLLYFCFFVQFEYGRETEFFFVRSQRTEFVGESFGQHGDGTVHQVDRGGPTLTLGVDHIARMDVMGDIGDVNPYFDIPVGKASDREGVVEVFGIVGVDGEGCYLSEVAA